MLYTAPVSVDKKIKSGMRLYYLIEGHGNDAVSPDRLDIEHYKNGKITWRGFANNYSVKLMKPAAEEWMRRVAVEAAKEDVVLASDEEADKPCYRKILAEMILNMFSGQLNLQYLGELSETNVN